MKLSEYARHIGITYNTAYRMWKAGQLDAYQLPTGTIIVREAQPAATGVATYARVSSVDQKADLARQVDRLRDYAAARGYVLTRFGFNYIRLLLAEQQRRIEIINTTDTGNDLVDDFVAVITSMATRLYGRRHARNQSERIKHCIQETDGDHAGLPNRTEAE